MAGTPSASSGAFTLSFRSISFHSFKAFSNVKACLPWPASLWPQCSFGEACHSQLTGMSFPAQHKSDTGGLTFACGYAEAVAMGAGYTNLRRWNNSL